MKDCPKIHARENHDRKRKKKLKIDRSMFAENKSQEMSILTYETQTIIYRRESEREREHLFSIRSKFSHLKNAKWTYCCCFQLRWTFSCFVHVSDPVDLFDLRTSNQQTERRTRNKKFKWIIKETKKMCECESFDRTSNVVCVQRPRFQMKIVFSHLIGAKSCLEVLCSFSDFVCARACSPSIFCRWPSNAHRRIDANFIQMQTELLVFWQMLFCSVSIGLDFSHSVGLPLAN